MRKFQIKSKPIKLIENIDRDTFNNDIYSKVCHYTVYSCESNVERLKVTNVQNRPVTCFDAHLI